jgi:hypothetical protein
MYKKEELMKWYNNEYCLKKVKFDGYNIAYTHNPSEELCMEAVKENHKSIQFIDIIKYPRVWDYYVLLEV